MSMGGGRRGSRVSSSDAAAQRAANAEAPRIPNLLPRIAELFRPHRTPLAITIVLVLVSAALSVIPPLLTQQAFDRSPPGISPPIETPGAFGSTRCAGASRPEATSHHQALIFLPS